MKRLSVAVSIALLACSQPPSRQERGPRPPAQRKPGALTISIVGTNDLHGAIDRLPLFAGYMENLRAARAADGGGLVLLDGGDMFQGTLESNINEGAEVVKAYNAIGYTAAAVGNHEFDFGPEGPAATPSSVEDDARGALKARAREAKFPMLVSNIVDQSSGNRIKWPNMPPSMLTEVGGLKIGIIGATTESTPFTTMPANFVGLQMRSPAQEVTAEAKVLRERGAQLIVVTAHIGTMCKHFDKPNDDSSCDRSEELYKMITDLPPNTVDVIVAGHTHSVIAHRINDIAVIESYSSGRAFGRVDLRVSPEGHVTSVKIHQPRLLCAGEKSDGNSMPIAQCKAGEYEGKPVAPVAAVQQIVDEAIAKAAERRKERLGVTLTGPVTASYGSESVEGNWFTDMMLVTNPGTHVAVLNGGGLRADMPAGELTYGQLYEAIPFDNRFVLVELKGSHVRKLVSSNLQKGGGILSWGGLTAKARCKGDAFDLQIKIGGKPLAESTTYRLVTSDFLAQGSTGLIGRLKLPEGSIKITSVVMRDAFADLLRKKKGSLDPSKLLSATIRRLDFTGQRPVTCGGKQQQKTPTDQEPTE